MYVPYSKANIAPVGEPSVDLGILYSYTSPKVAVYKSGSVY